MKIKKVQPTIRVRIPKSVSGAASQQTLIRSVRINSGLPAITEIRAELDEYIEVLLGRTPPPIDNEEMTMMEYANAVYSRAMEITMMIQRAESDGAVLKNSKYYRFRTGELRSFTELSARCIELGSRRVTWAQIDYNMTHG